jgi:dienelactone hydrolase
MFPPHESRSMSLRAHVYLATLLPSLTMGVAPADRRVTIQSDGWTLVGDFHESGRTGRAPAVLLLHGAARDRRAYITLADELAKRGIASLRIDLRGEGESTNRGRFVPGRRSDILDGTDRDVAAALRWLRVHRDVDPVRIGVLGASYSGEAMAIAARQGSPAAAYVALSPGSFSDSSARAIDPSGIPWWFLASRNERFAQSIVQRIPTMSRAARITIVEGNAHASDMLSPQFVLNDEIADWFAARLAGATAPSLWGSLDVGSYAVGFRSDSVRPASGGAIRIDTWYPARAAAPRPLRFGDYLRLSDDIRGATQGFPSSPGSLGATLAATMTGDSAGLAAEVIDQILAAEMAAGRSTPEAPGRFPLVLWTPRYATTVAQSVLSEYLASHGFVVAFARPLANEGRLPFELPTRDAKLVEQEKRVRDMRVALTALEVRPNVDASSIGVIAWSYTGDMASRFQQGEPRVALVAGLSTGLLGDLVYPDTAALSAERPLINAVFAVLTQRGTEPTRRPRELGRARAAYFIEFPGVAHGSFNALEGFIPSLRRIERVQPWSQSSMAGARSYEATAVILKRLLRHHLGAKLPQALPAHPLLAGISEYVVMSDTTNRP